MRLAGLDGEEDLVEEEEEEQADEQVVDEAHGGGRFSAVATSPLEVTVRLDLRGREEQIGGVVLSFFEGTVALSLFVNSSIGRMTLDTTPVCVCMSFLRAVIIIGSTAGGTLLKLGQGENQHDVM